MPGGNAYADKLADRAAVFAEVTPKEAEEVDKARVLCTEVQQRLVCILLDLVTRFPRHFQRNGLGRMGIRSKFSKLALQTKHRAAFLGESVYCVACLGGCTGNFAERAQWLGTPCPGFHEQLEVRRIRTPNKVPQNSQVWVTGVRLHDSHDLYAYKGLYFCRACGFLAGHRVDRLRAPCVRVPTEQGRRNLARLARGQLPHGTPGWPCHGLATRQTRLAV